MDETARATTPPTSWRAGQATGPRNDPPRAGREPAHPPAWSTRLTEAVETVYLALRINVVWMLLSLLGLVLLGVGPATVAAAGAFRAARDGNRVRVMATMWGSFRTHLVPANLRMLPLLVVQAGALAMVWTLAGGTVDSSLATAVLGTLAAVAAGWATAALGVITAVPRVRDQELFVTWRLALMIPAALPLRTLPMIGLVLLWVLLCSMFWPLVPLLGGATAIGIAVALLGRRTELLLEDVVKRQGADAPQ